MGKSRKINRAIYVYDHMEEIILVAMLTMIVVVAFLQVIMRYVFNNSLSWAEEFGRFFFVWLTWIGISIGAKRGQHIRIEFLVNKMPFRVAQVMNLISDLMVFMVCIVTIYYGAYLAQAFSGLKFVSIQMSQAWGYAALPTGCTLMILRSLPSTWQSIKNLIKGPNILTAEEGGDQK